MFLDIVNDNYHEPSLVETNLPWRDNGDIVSFSQSRTYDAAFSFLDSKVVPSINNAELPQNISAEEVKLDYCGLSELPWRSTLHEVPSLSVMCSEGTCPSFYETENSHHHLEVMHIPSKIDLNCDNDPNLCRSSQEDDKLAFSTADLSLSDEKCSKNGSCIPKRHCFPPRHKSYHQLCQQQSNRSSNPPPPHAPAPRFVLECDDWKDEDEAAWGNLENRVWSWLDQLDHKSFVDSHEDESLDSALPDDANLLDDTMTDPSFISDYNINEEGIMYTKPNHN